MGTPDRVAAMASVEVDGPVRSNVSKSNLNCNNISIHFINFV